MDLAARLAVCWLLGGSLVLAAPEAPPGDDVCPTDVFLRDCAPCHGAGGDGSGALARFQPSAPVDFTADKYRSDAELTDDELFGRITEGVPQTTMPSWELLPESTRRALVHCIRDFADHPDRGPLASITESSPPLNHADGVRYVGRDACRECHEEIWTTFTKTGMGRSFYPMSPDNVVEDLVEQNEIAHPVSDLRYRTFERDGKFYQRQFRLGASGEEVAVDEHELVYAIGSNNHGRGYITVQNGKLFQAPACWDRRLSSWILCPGFETANDHFSREIGHTCVFCHNGRMERVGDERNRYVEPIPNGIGCERCHGPGELHVRRHQATREGVPAAAGRTIVNPRDLPRELRIQVCFQCHLGDATATERIERHDRVREDFRPGMPLDDFLVPFRYVQPTHDAFGIASQADRLILSRCYTESGGALECLTCHDPHVTVYREDRPVELFNDKCRECHAPAPCREPDSASTDCVACHMRRGEPADRKHAQFTDHWIRRDISVRGDRRTRFDLEPILPESFEKMPAGERAYALGRAYLLREAQAPPASRGLHLERARQLFEQAVLTGFDEADAWFFMGKIHRQRGESRQAGILFARALELDPQHHDAALALGQLLIEAQDVVTAVRVFERMLGWRSDDPMALAEHGRALAALGRTEAALEAYGKAIEVEPWNAALWVNRARLLAANGEPKKAAEAASNGLRLDPDNPAVRELVEELLQQAP